MIDETLLQDLPLGQQIEITENTIRKNFTFSEMCEIISKLKPKLDEEAKKRRQAGVKLSPGEPKFKVRDEIAHYVGVSGGQIDKIMAIEQQVRENPKEFGNIPQRIESGMSIDYAHKMINTAKKATTPTPNLPKNQYEVIVADPPWKYDLPLEGAPDYKTMTLEEMKLEIPNVPSYKDCILFMWTTNPKLDEALSLMKHWGFTYKTNMVWVKQKNNKLQNGTGYYFKGSHELLLVGTKGTQEFHQSLYVCPLLEWQKEQDTLKSLACFIV